VKAATQEEHYREIAALEMVLRGKGARTLTQLTLEADAIRNKVARYDELFEEEKEEINHQRIDPEALRQEAEDEVAEWRESKETRVLGS
jgi:hypothetical protein